MRPSKTELDILAAQIRPLERIGVHDTFGDVAMLVT